MPFLSNLTRDIAQADPNRNINSLNDFGRSQIGQSDAVFGGSFSDIVDSSTQADREEQAELARDRSTRDSDNLSGQLRRRQKALGLSLSDRQQKSQSRRLSLTRAINEASAVTSSNRTSARIAEQANRASVSLQDEFEATEASGLSSLASAEGARNRRLASERAAKKEAKNSVIGTGLGALIALSSESAKDKIEVAPHGLLNKLSGVRVDRWRYRGDDRDHIGPYAEEFNDTFGVGKGARGMINLVDAVGVTMAAVKELNKKVEARSNA